MVELNNAQYKANLGNNAEFGQESHVTNQYARPSAEGKFVPIFDSAEACNDSQLRIFNICTYIKGYEMPTAAGSRLCLLGKMEFGIGGGTSVVDFDWKEGNQISVAASFVRLSAAFSEVDVGAAGTTVPSKVSVGAMLSSGSRAARAQNTRTYPRLLVNDASVVLFPIPPFAHALNLFANEPGFYTGTNISVRFVGAATAGFSAASTGLQSWQSNGAPFLNALANEDGVRFPESARFVELSTAVPATDYHVTPVFTLSI